jgi:hypothetical protein
MEKNRRYYKKSRQMAEKRYYPRWTEQLDRRIWLPG